VYEKDGEKYFVVGGHPLAAAADALADLDAGRVRGRAILVP